MISAVPAVNGYLSVREGAWAAAVHVVETRVRSGVLRSASFSPSVGVTLTPTPAGGWSWYVLPFLFFPASRSYVWPYFPPIHSLPPMSVASAIAKHHRTIRHHQSSVVHQKSSTLVPPPSPASVPESCVGSVADELQAAAAAQHWRCGVKRKVIQDVRD